MLGKVCPVERSDRRNVRDPTSADRPICEEASMKVRSTQDDETRWRCEVKAGVRAFRVFVASVEAVCLGERGERTITIRLRRVKHLDEDFGLHVTPALVEVTPGDASVTLVHTGVSVQTNLRAKSSTELAQGVGACGCTTEGETQTGCLRPRLRLRL
jgi:hypothetical protein